MHCPRCRSCGLNLEKVSELLGDELMVESSSSIDDRARLRERQRTFEQWRGIARRVG
jgi:hypothetical protein